MNGYADFIFTPHGWRCTVSYVFETHRTERKIEYSSLMKELMINGEFVQVPKPGQFTRRPDLLIDWSKS